MEAERVCVVGCSGAGKSTFARRLGRLGYARLELDGVYHQAGWTHPEEEAARSQIAAFTSAHARWVVDGNYAAYRDLLWTRADTIVWLDLDRRVVVPSVAWRSLRRLVTREELWNGNREEWRNVLSLDPERSVVMWSWSRFHHYREEYERLMRAPEWAHLCWLRVRSRGEARRILARAARDGSLRAER